MYSKMDFISDVDTFISKLEKGGPGSGRHKLKENQLVDVSMDNGETRTGVVVKPGKEEHTIHLLGTFKPDKVLSTKVTPMITRNNEYRFYNMKTQEETRHKVESIDDLDKGGPGSGRKSEGRREEPAISEYRNLVGRYNQAASQFKDDKQVQDYMHRLKSSWRSHILDLSQSHVNAIRSSKKEGEQS